MPKPAEVRRRQGNPAKRKLPDTVMIGGRAAPRMPAKLSPRAKTIWKQLVPHFAEIGMLDQVDGPALYGMCASIAMMQDAYEQLQREPLLVEGSMGQPRPNPLIQIFRDAQTDVRAWCDRFGLDPAARTRLGLQEQKRRTLAAEMSEQLGAPKLKRVK